MQKRKIGFIGFGNMAKAMAEGWLHKGNVEELDIYACSKSYEKCKKACEGLGGVHALETAIEVCEKADLIILAVKPNVIEGLLPELSPYLAEKTVLSIIWGFSFERLSKLLPISAKLLCTIPNIPVSIGKGVISIERTHSLDDMSYQELLDLLSILGQCITVDQKNMDIAGTISSCGVAFANVFIEALADAGVCYGLPRETAYALSSAMLEGTAGLQRESQIHPAEMKDRVCSPGGATIKGIVALEDKGFRSAVISAISAVQKG